MSTERNRRLNTPKSENIDDLFLQTIGLHNLSMAWSWTHMTTPQAQEKLDKYVTLRGAIAHRGQAKTSCQKPAVQDFLNHVTRLVDKTDGRVNGFVTKATGKPLW